MRHSDTSGLTKIQAMQKLLEAQGGVRMFGMMGAPPPRKTEPHHKEEGAEEAAGEVETNVKIGTVKENA